MLMLIVPTCSSAGGKLKRKVIMLSKSFVLLMLIHTPNVGHQEIFIGKIPSCLVASDVIEKKVKRDKIQNQSGYICVAHETWVANKRYLKKLTPIQERLIKDIQERLPEIKPKPLTPLKRKD